MVAGWEWGWRQLQGEAEARDGAITSTGEVNKLELKWE